MSTPRIATIPTDRPGRPKGIQKEAERIIGTAGYSALMDADLFIVSGPLLRDLALVLGEPVPPMPDGKLTKKGLALLSDTEPETVPTET